MCHNFEIFACENTSDISSKFDQKDYKPLGFSKNEDFILKVEQAKKLKYIIVKHVEYYSPKEYTKTEKYKLAPSYVIGVSNKDIPFSISRGLPNLIEFGLDKEYKYQNYIYEHNYSNNPLYLHLTVFSNRVNFFADFKPIDNNKPKEAKDPKYQKTSTVTISL